MLDRRFVSHFDWTFFGAVLALVAAGLIAVYSATFTMGGGRHGLFMKQVYWLAIGFSVMLASLGFDYHRLERWGYVLYGAALLMLAVVLVLGRTGMGAQRWLPPGPLSFQPSAPAKLFLIITLAKYFAEDGVYNGHTLKMLVRPLLLVMVPAALVVKQPDLGTAMMF